jgi:L-fucose mutarotase/ribose pyranase (RbsD/FucU family)
MVDSIVVLRRETRTKVRRLARNQIADAIILVLDIEESVNGSRETMTKSRRLAWNQSVRHHIESLIVREAKEGDHVTIIKRQNDMKRAESTRLVGGMGAKRKESSTSDKPSTEMSSFVGTGA